MTGLLAATWWGHASTTIEIGTTRVGTDPMFADRLVHLRRHGPRPPATATQVDLVLVSHLHADHLHVPTLAVMAATAPIVVPRGAGPLLRSLRGRHVVEAEPGDRLELCDLSISVLPARHDGRRHPLARLRAPALGFRVESAAHTFWYPGDTGMDPRMADVDPVDLAVVPIGGWGPSLGDQHLGPEDAADAVDAVGARWALPVHYGTFWPMGLQTVHRSSHERLFVAPPARFTAALGRRVAGTTAVVPGHGERIVLDG